MPGETHGRTTRKHNASYTVDGGMNLLIYSAYRQTLFANHYNAVYCLLEKCG